MNSNAAFSFVLVLVGLFALVVIGIVSECNDYFKKRKAAAEAKALAEKIARLRKEHQVLRLENNIEAEKLWSQLRPMKVEARAAGVLKQRDERMLDWMMTRQALDQVIGGPRTIDANPLATATAAIGEEIENRKADGGETSQLEELMRRLRGFGERGAA